jgi:hypothetical protein
MVVANSNSRIQSLKWAILPILLLALVGGYVAGRGGFAAPTAPVADVMPLSPAIEAQWGVRITQIGVTADGGLLDFRYLVIDPDKALAMLQDDKNLPVLTAEDSGLIVDSAALMAHKHDLAAGRTYFLLYRNAKGAIKRGTPVTIMIGDLRLEHAVAK